MLFLLACGGATQVDLFDKRAPDASLEDAGALDPDASTEPDAGGEPPPPPPSGDPCSASSPECSRGLVCVVPSCSGPGTCEPAANFRSSPVCGCNKTTYFSAELAAGAVAIREGAACSSAHATPCSLTQKCPVSGAKCAMKTGAACVAATAIGTCWMPPDKCPAAKDSFRLCRGSRKCSNECEALKSEEPYTPDSNCK